MEFEYNEILTETDWDCDGIYWVTKSDLTIKSPGIHEVNYLFDGALNQSLQVFEKSQKTQNVSYYLTQNFNKPFFLVHLKYDSQTVKQDLESLLKIANEPSHQAKKLLCIHDVDQNICIKMFPKDLIHKMSFLNLTKK